MKTLSQMNGCMQLMLCFINAIYIEILTCTYIPFNEKLLRLKVFFAFTLDELMKQQQ